MRFNGVQLDRNGYAPSLLTQSEECCYRCCRQGMKLDRHEVFQASNRDKSKAYGAWCLLCRECHEEIHRNADASDRLHRKAQQVLMDHYGWSIGDFIRIFGKNYI